MSHATSSESAGSLVATGAAVADTRHDQLGARCEQCVQTDVPWAWKVAALKTWPRVTAAERDRVCTVWTRARI